MNKRSYHKILVIMLLAASVVMQRATADASILLYDFKIYWNASGAHIDDAKDIAENYIRPKLDQYASQSNIDINDVVIEYMPEDSGYFYPMLDSDLQSDLDQGSIALEGNDVISKGQVNGGYTWYYNDPGDAHYLGWHVNQYDEIVKTFVFGAVRVPHSTVPVPSTLVLMAGGIGAIIMGRKKMR